MTRKTILITGGGGLVGSSFIGQKVKKDYNFIYPSHGEMDISDKKQIKKFVERHKPDVIINFAAHRNANTAEEQRNSKKGSAWKTNVIGVENLVGLSKKQGLYLIQISTDMVFSGFENRKGPYSEIDLPDDKLKNLSWYGWTKVLGEKEVLDAKMGASVVRIANVTKPVYDPSLDYVGKILWLYDQKKLYSLFYDQYLSLSYIPDVISAIDRLLKKKIGGVFHVGSSNLVTPFEMAEYLLFKSRSVKNKVGKVSIDEFLKNMPNRYPKFGGLKSEYTQKKLGIKFPSWQKIVDNFIKHAKI